MKTKTLLAFALAAAVAFLPVFLAAQGPLGGLFPGVGADCYYAHDPELPAFVESVRLAVIADGVLEDGQTTLDLFLVAVEANLPANAETALKMRLLRQEFEPQATPELAATFGDGWERRLLLRIETFDYGAPDNSERVALASILWTVARQRVTALRDFLNAELATTPTVPADLGDTHACE